MQDFLEFKGEVKKQLEKRRWKYRDLAKAIGVSESTIRSVMCGARGTDEVIKAMIEALNIPPHIGT
ncbi:MAG: helix-turn-helix transcriptional regulator [Oscillospiraceae bacterium]|nr:helix-turn-helix transcriptional regulator [Oscillospiraceae bacterium]